MATIIKGTKTKTTRKTASSPKASAKPKPTVDYPQASEVVSSTDYSIRVGAHEATRVEISIDGGPWRPCRPSVGFWWYDWSAFEPGNHQLKARAYFKEGKPVSSVPTNFSVKLADLA